MANGIDPQQISDIFLGASAGLQGRGPEFAQALGQRRERERIAAAQEEEQRRQAFFQDSLAGLNFAKEGRFDLVAELAQERLSIAQQIGGNMEGTQQAFDLATLAADGNKEAADRLTATLKNNVAVGQGAGFIQGPSQREQADTRFAEARATKAERELAGDFSDPQADKRTAQERNLDRVAALRKEGRDNEADQLSRAAGLMAKDPTKGRLSAALEKSLFQSQDEAVTAGRRVRELGALANDFDRLSSAGSASNAKEFFKQVAGTQDEQTELRRRLNKVRLSQALELLPPGPATDKDVEEAMKGVPRGNASAEQVQSFLRGAAKIAALDEEFSQFKSDYISENRTRVGMLKEWRDLQNSGGVSAIQAFTPRGEQPAPRQAAPQAAPAEAPAPSDDLSGFSIAR